MTEKELKDETYWIWNIISKEHSKFDGVDHSKLETRIYNVLEAFRKHHMDIPFIIFY